MQIKMQIKVKNAKDANDANTANKMPILQKNAFADFWQPWLWAYEVKSKTKWNDIVIQGMCTVPLICGLQFVHVSFLYQTALSEL